MGIYDPILQAYGQGIDRQIQLRQQQPSLAQAILQGYGQGHQWKMQDAQLALQQAQLQEMARHRQMQEAEAQAWHQGQLADRLSKQAQETVFQTPEQSTAFRDILQRKAGMTASEAAGVAPMPQKDPFAKGAVDLGEGVVAPAEPLQPGTQGYEGEYIPQYGSKALQKQQEFERKSQHDQDLQFWRQGRLDLDTQKALVAQGVSKARIDKMNEDIRLGRSLEPYKQDLMSAQAWRARNYLPESSSFGFLSPRMAQAFDAAVARVLTEENSRRQKANENIIGGKDITTGRAAQPLPMLGRQEAEDMVTSGWERLAAKGSEGGGIAIEGGGPVLKKVNPRTGKALTGQGAPEAAKATMGKVVFKHKGTGAVKEFNILKNAADIKKLRDNPDFEEVK